MAAVKELTYKSAPPRTPYTPEVQVVRESTNHRNLHYRGPLGKLLPHIPGGFRVEPLRGIQWYRDALKADPSGRFLDDDPGALMDVRVKDPETGVVGMPADALTNPYRKVIVNSDGVAVSVMGLNYALVSHAEVFHAAVDKMVGVFGTDLLDSRADLLVSDLGLSCILRIVLEDTGITLGNGERLYGRATLFNDLAGASRIGAAIDLWRLVCHNGMHGFREFAKVAAIHSKQRTSELDITCKINDMVEVFPRVAEQYNRWIEHKVDPVVLEDMFEPVTVKDTRTGMLEAKPSKASEVFGITGEKQIWTVLQSGTIGGHRAGLTNRWGSLNAYDVYNAGSVLANLRKGASTQESVIAQASRFVEEVLAEEHARTSGMRQALPAPAA